MVFIFRKLWPTKSREGPNQDRLLRSRIHGELQNYFDIMALELTLFIGSGLWEPGQKAENFAHEIQNIPCTIKSYQTYIKLVLKNKTDKNVRRTKLPKFVPKILSTEILFEKLYCSTPTQKHKSFTTANCYKLFSDSIVPWSCGRFLTVFTNIIQHQTAVECTVKQRAASLGSITVSKL